MEGKAGFPPGPFSMAVQRSVNMLAVFVMKTSIRKYHIYVRQLPVPSGTNKQDKIKELAQAFANELENMIRMYPTQWFNYFDFWEE